MKVATIYETTDGKEFTDELKAQKHQKIIDLKNAYKDARRDYVNALSNEEKTIDGIEFSGRYHDYCYIQVYEGMPYLCDVNFFHDWEFDVHDQTDELILLQPKRNGDRGYTQIRISEVYHDRNTAKKALVEAQLKYLKTQAKTLNMDVVPASLTPS